MPISHSLSSCGRTLSLGGTQVAINSARPARRMSLVRLTRGKDNVGVTKYWASTAELRTPVPWIPPETGLRFSVFADGGSLWGYAGPGSAPALAQSLQVADSNAVRSSIGTGLIWDLPLGPLRVDYAYATSKAASDLTQRMRLGAWGF